MKLITLLLTLALTFTAALPAQSKKDEVKKAATDAKAAKGEAKKAAAEAKSEAKGEAKKAAAEAKSEAKEAKGVAAKKASEGKDLPSQNERCQAQTQDGDQCKRKAGAGSKFCWQHAAAQKKGPAKSDGEAKTKKKAA